MDYKLIVLDADGTLVDRETGELLPGVEDWLGLINHPGCTSRPKLAIATNQGGPACHDAGWEFSHKFPSLDVVERRYEALAERIGAKLFMSLLYITSDGQHLVPQRLAEQEHASYYDGPDAKVGRRDPRLSPHWRKPNPGMVEAAMAWANVSPEETLVIGDLPEDKEAAGACHFQWAQKFFARGWEKGKDHGLLR